MKPFLETLKRQPSAELRSYLLNYSARSLFDSKNHTTLFTLLDDKSYKHAKLEYDPSTTLYARDLDLGCKAAISERWGIGEQINHLPHLWRYSFLRSSLTSRVDAYPDAAFTLLLRLGHQEQAERSAELLTSPTHRAHIFTLLGSEYAMWPGQVGQNVRLFEQAYASAQAVVDRTERNNTLSTLGQACIQGNQPSLARRVITSIEDSTKRTEGLKALSQALTQAGQWELAREVIALLDDNKERTTALKALAQVLVQASEWSLAWEIFTTIEDNIEKVQELSTFGAAVAQANDLRNALLVWREALRVLNVCLNDKYTIPNTGQALGALVTALIHNSEQQEVAFLYFELSEIINGLPATSIEDRLLKDTALYQFCQALIQCCMWPLVLEIVPTMQTPILVIRTACELRQAVVMSSEEQMRAGEEINAIEVSNMAAGLWQMVRIILAGMEMNSVKAGALTVFGESLMQAQQSQEALQVWHEARDILLAETDGSLWRPVSLTSLSCTMAKAGYGQESLELLSTIQGDEWRDRDNEYYELLKVLLATQQWQIARNVSRTIQHFHKRHQGFKDTCQALIQAREWQLALNVIEEMHQEKIVLFETDVLQELYKMLAQASDTQEVAQLWQEMQSIFAKIIPAFGVFVAEVAANAGLRELAKVLAQSEQWQAARDIIKFVGGGYIGESMAREFCQLLAQAHRWEEARKVATSIRVPSEQARALSELGLEFVATGQRQEAAQAWQETQKVLATTASSLQTESALRFLSLGLAQSQQWSDALHIILMIEDKEEKVGALSNLGGEAVLSGNESLAATIWQTARSIAATISNPSWHVRALSEMGQAMAQVGREKEAREIWREAQGVIASIEDSYGNRKRAEELAQKMLHTKLWREVWSIVVSVLGSNDIDTELGKLGIMLIQAGQLQEAQVVLTTMTSNSWQTSQLVSELVPTLVRQGNFQEAQEALATIRDSTHYKQTLSELAPMIAQARTEEARPIWQEIRDQLSTKKDAPESCPLIFEEIYQKAKELSILGQAMEWTGSKQEAFQLWQEAREIILSLVDSPKKVEAMSELGKSMAQAGHMQEAFQLWQEAQAFIPSIKEHSEKVNALSILGQAMMQADLEQEAWQVWQEALSIITSTHERVIRWLDSFDETGIGKEQQEQILATTRENYPEETRALRRMYQESAREYQGQEKQEEMVAMAERVGEVFSSISHNTELQKFGTIARAWMLGFASNSVSSEALSRFSQVLAEANHCQEARDVLTTIEDGSSWRDDAWLALARSLMRSDQWQEARDAATSIEESKNRTTILQEIVTVLAQKKQWQLAWNTLTVIEEGEKRTETLRELSNAIVQNCTEGYREIIIADSDVAHWQDLSSERSQQLTESPHIVDYPQMLTVLRQAWLVLTTSEEVLAAFPLVHGFVQRSPELGKTLTQGFTWVADFLKFE